MLTLEVLNGEAADVDRVGGVELVPDVHQAGVQGHRCRLQFECAARFVTLLDRAVFFLVFGCGAVVVGVVVGQADDREQFAGIHVHHDAGGADRAEGVHRGEQFLPHDGLHAHIQRQPQRALVRAEAGVERFFHAGDAQFVNVDTAKHLRRHTAHRVVALLGGPEIDPRQPEIVDRQFLLRGDLTLQIDELLGALGQTPDGQVFVQPRQYLLELMGGVDGVDDLPRVGEDRDRR